MLAIFIEFSQVDNLIYFLMGTTNNIVNLVSVMYTSVLLKLIASRATKVLFLSSLTSGKTNRPSHAREN